MQYRYIAFESSDSNFIQITIKQKYFILQNILSPKIFPSGVIFEGPHY